MWKVRFLPFSWTVSRAQIELEIQQKTFERIAFRYDYCNESKHFVELYTELISQAGALYSASSAYDMPRSASSLFSPHQSAANPAEQAASEAKGGDCKEARKLPADGL